MDRLHIFKEAVVRHWLLRSASFTCIMNLRSINTKIYVYVHWPKCDIHEVSYFACVCGVPSLSLKQSNLASYVWNWTTFWPRLFPRVNASIGKTIYWWLFSCTLSFSVSFHILQLGPHPMQTHPSTPFPVHPLHHPEHCNHIISLFFTLYVCVCACERSYFHISVNFVSVTVTKTLQVLLCNPNHPFTEPKKLAAILRLGCLFPLPNVKKIVWFIVRHKC